MAVDFSAERSATQISQINVTPLVDVMLVLLVIFMVTAPILQQGVQVNLPQAQAGAIASDEEPLVVSIAPDGRVYLNDNVISLSDLGKKLRAVRQINKDKEVYLRADQNVRYGAVMKTVEEIKQAGIVKLGMVTRPPTESGEKGG
jgi:biopolymer transport protein TolR